MHNLTNSSKLCYMESSIPFRVSPSAGYDMGMGGDMCPTPHTKIAPECTTGCVDIATKGLN